MTTAVEKRNDELAQTTWGLLQKMKPAIAGVLPKHITPERMAMIAFTAMRRTPKLMECSPQSIMGSILTASMLGLEPSGPLGHGALIPYKGECQFQPMYQGLLDLARRSGFIKDVQLRAVYKGDTYSYQFGLDPYIEHVPMEGEAAEDPNREATHVYCIIRFTNGGVQWDQMSVAQGLAHGKKFSPSWNTRDAPGQFKPGSVWATDPLAMILKTILKKVLKLCPKSAEMAVALQIDDATDVGRTASARKEADGVYDVDFGEEPSGDAGGNGNGAGATKQLNKGTVDLDAMKEGPGNRGHGGENLDEVKKDQPQVGKPTAAATAPVTAATINVPEPTDPEAKCTEEQFKNLENAQTFHDVEPKVFIAWVRNVLGYRMVSSLQQKYYKRALAFLMNGGKEEA